MTTIELEKGTYELVEGDDEDDHDDEVCHLYYPNKKISLCGVHSSTDPHATKHGWLPWKKGVFKCAKCGVPICMDCVLQAS